MAFLGVSGTLVIVIYLVKRYVQFSFWKNVTMPLIATLVQGVWYWVLLRIVPQQLVWLIALGGSGVILYAGILWMTQKQHILEIIHISQSK